MVHCYKMSAILERSDGPTVVGPYYYDGLVGSFTYDLSDSFIRNIGCEDSSIGAIYDTIDYTE